MNKNNQGSDQFHLELQELGCQIDTFCVKMTQFDVEWHNDTFSRNDDTIDVNDTFFDKKWHNRRKWHILKKKKDPILSSKSCFLNDNKRKVKFKFSISRKATN